MKGYVRFRLDFEDTYFVMQARVADDLDKEMMDRMSCEKCKVNRSKYFITYERYKETAIGDKKIRSSRQFICADCARDLFEIMKTKDGNRKERMLMGKVQSPEGQVKFDITKSLQGPLHFNEKRLPDCGCEMGKVEVVASFYFFYDIYPTVSVGYCLRHFKKLEDSIVEAFSKFKEEA